MPSRTGPDVAAPQIDDLAIQREQDRRILELALAGNNGVTIAAQVGVDRSTVTRTLQRIWARTEQPKAEELRGKWDMRIEAGIAAIWDKFLDGDIAAVNAFVRLAERAAKMHGLDQQATKDAGALADALLGDPEARRERAQQLRDDVAEARARRREAEAAGG
jgi:alpha-D-ribose 1-methylphosphonate 5-triphosphate synthase subunit PhnG